MIRLRILGPIELRSADDAELRSLLAQPKRTALLAYLAAESGRGFQRRDTLLGLFWPEMDEARARAALSRALHFLRGGLGNETLTSRGDEELSVNPAKLWCDVVAFDAARAAGDHAGALALYRGELLDGFFIEETPEFERWLERERRRLRLAAGASAGALADARAASGDLTGAVEAARRGVDVDPHDEIALRRLLTLLERSGDRAGAIAAYEVAAKRLATELEIEPAAETNALVAEIRARASAPAAVPRERLVSADPSTSLGMTAPVPGERSESVIPSERSESRDLQLPPAVPPYEKAARSRMRMWMLAALVLVVITATMATWWRHLGGGRRSETSEPVVAVLPFADLSASHDQAYFSDGMADELISSLGAIPGLDVVARTSSFSFRDRDVPVEQIARALHATHLVEGSVRREGDRLRVTVQLVDASTGYRVWSKSFDERARNVLAVQDTISREVVDALQAHLDTRVAAQPARDVAPEVHDLYLKGRYIQQGAYAYESTANVAASEAYRQALAHDSTYAPAWAGLADVLVLMDQPKAAREAVERALQLDSTLAEGHAARALLLATMDYRWDDAMREIDRAVELAPASAPILLRRAEMRTAVGRRTEAIADADRAYRLDPLSPTVAEHRAATYLAADRWDDAARMYGAIIASRPERGDAHVGLALALLGKGKGREAAKEFLATYHDTVSASIALADRALMEKMLHTGRDVPGARHPAAIAALYAHLGMMDSAFAQLEQARLQLRGQPEIADIPRDPRLMVMRSDPRFAVMEKRWLKPPQ